MGLRFSKDSVDSNHKDVVKELRKLGAVVTSVTCVKEFCDIVACFNGSVILIEVKDGSKPPSQRRLTEREQKYHDKLEKVGCVVHIVNNLEEVNYLIDEYRN